MMNDVVQRQLLLDIRSLLLKAVDLIERYLLIGKYKTQMVEVGERDNIAWASLDTEKNDEKSAQNVVK